MIAINNNLSTTCLRKSGKPALAVFFHWGTRFPKPSATTIASAVPALFQYDVKMTISKTRTINLRVDTLPTLLGEKIVLRILDPSLDKLRVDAVGYEDEKNPWALKKKARTESASLFIYGGQTNLSS